LLLDFHGKSGIHLEEDYCRQFWNVVWSEMEKISRTSRVKNEEVLHKSKKKWMFRT